jgi:hypothetical protein
MIANRRFAIPSLSLLSLVLLALVWAGEERGAAPSSQPAGKSQSNVYRNERYDYEVRYPRSWFPSGVIYGNAFEIRNYPSGRPGARPARDRATLLILDMPMGSRAEARRFLNALLAQGSNAKRRVTRLTIAGRRAVRVRQRLPAQQLGPGFAPPVSGVRQEILHLKTYVTNRSFVLQLWGTARANARKEVIADLARIENAVSFLK